METPRDHRRCAEECVAMAQAAGYPNDKALWSTLAQSWVRLSEHEARVEGSADASGDTLTAPPPE